MPIAYPGGSLQCGQFVDSLALFALGLQFAEFAQLDLVIDVSQPPSAEVAAGAKVEGGSGAGLLALSLEEGAESTLAS